MAGKTSGKISTLVISPTRELASQIAVEAEALGRFHDITVQVHRLQMSMSVVWMLELTVLHSGAVKHCCASWSVNCLHLAVTCII